MVVIPKKSGDEKKEMLGIPCNISPLGQLTSLISSLENSRGRRKRS